MIEGLACILLLKNENRYIYGIKDRKPEFTMLQQQMMFLKSFVQNVYIMDGDSKDESMMVYNHYRKNGLIKRISVSSDFDEAGHLELLKNQAFEDKNKWLLYLDGDEILEDSARNFIRNYCNSYNHNVNQTVRFIYANLWRSRNKYRLDKWYGMEAGKLFSLTKDLKSYGTEFNNHWFGFRTPNDFGNVYQTNLHVLHYAWVDWENVRKKYEKCVNYEMMYNNTPIEKAKEDFKVILDEEGIVLKPCEHNWSEEFRSGTIKYE